MVVALTYLVQRLYTVRPNLVIRWPKLLYRERLPCDERHCSFTNIPSKLAIPSSIVESIPSTNCTPSLDGGGLHNRDEFAGIPAQRPTRKIPKNRICFMPNSSQSLAVMTIELLDSPYIQEYPTGKKISKIPRELTDLPNGNAN